MESAESYRSALRGLGTELGDVFEIDSWRDGLSFLFNNVPRAIELIREFRTASEEGGGGGFLSGAATFLGGLFGGGRQGGGPVREGQIYEVGERGRELFVPNQDGSIIPNGQYGNVTINLPALDLSSDVRSTMIDFSGNLADAGREAAYNARLN